MFLKENQSLLNSSDYVTHHLQNFSTYNQKSIIDFNILNLDTIFWSIICAFIVILILYYVICNITSGAPGRLQCSVEILVEVIKNQSSAIIKGKHYFIEPLAFTVFTWILIMNSLDFIPVDLPNKILNFFSLSKTINFHRIVPTSDINGTLGISTMILLLIIYYNLKTKGIINFIYIFSSTPFGKHPLLWIPNFILNLTELFAKTVSLGMRLFGNMYSGELLFLLIALLGSVWSFKLDLTIFGFISQIIFGFLWSLFHIFIIFLQSFIFMMLTLVYIGQACDNH